MSPTEQTSTSARLFTAFTGNAYLLLVIAPLLWGGNAVAGRLAAAYWEPFTLTSIRWGVASIILLPFAWRPLIEDWPVLKRSWPVLFVLGAFGMSLFNLFMYLALKHTTAINASIEQASMPIFIMLLNFIFLSQRVRVLQLVGVSVTLVGVLLTATAGEPLNFFTNGLNRGDAIMLLASVFYALYTFGLRWRPKVHWMSFMCVISISAFIMTIPFASWELSRSSFELPTYPGWLILVYVVIFPTVISQLAYARGVELIGSNRAGLFINLVPIFGSLLAVLIVGERFQWFHAAGLVLVLGGIALAERNAGR